MSSFATSGDQVKIVRLSDADKKKALRDLPPENTKRWVINRKAAVLKAIELGVLQKKEACEKYHISEEEIDSWSRLSTHGVSALRATRLQEYRARGTSGQQSASSAE